MVRATNTRGWAYPEDTHSVAIDNTGVTWYLLDCRYAFGDWIETQDTKLWRVEGAYHHCRYWVDEKLMSLILLRG